jgi:hypothetical protein
VIELIPAKFLKKYPGRHRKVINCIAPSRDMVKGAITTRAQRIDQWCWDAHYTPLRWWQRAPKVELLDRPLHWLVDATHYRWARQCEILATEFHLYARSLGPDMRVIAYSNIDKGREGHKQLNCYVRKVLYLRADVPGDGVLGEPQDDAIRLPGRRPKPHNVATVMEHYAAYRAELAGRAKGWMLHPGTHVWVDPAQFAAEQQYENEQREFRRRAGC